VETSTRNLIISLIQQVAAEQGKHLVPLSDDVALLDTGLDSLCLAIIVARLEDRVGFDPFSIRDDVLAPTTVGQFVALYDHAAQ
jgi:acyl carrier protein